MQTRALRDLAEPPGGGIDFFRAASGGAAGRALPRGSAARQTFSLSREANGIPFRIAFPQFFLHRVN